MIADKFKVKAECGLGLLSKYILLRLLCDYDFVAKDKRNKDLIFSDDFLIEQMIEFDKQCKVYISKRKRKKNERL